MKVPNKNKLTYVAVRDELALLGVRLLRDATGNKDYKVNFIGGDEPTAYYTSDLKDALATGIDMAKRKQKKGPNLGALLATNGFVQNYKKSSGILTFWENGDVFAITSPNGFGLYVGDTSYGGSTEEHLRGYLATFTSLKQTLSKQPSKLRVVFTHEVEVGPALTPQQLLEMVLDGLYTWADMGKVQIQNHLGQVLAQETQEPEEGSYQAFTPKDDSAGEKQRVEANLSQEAMAEVEVYRFFDQEGHFIMVAPMSTAQKFWRLHDDAVQRAEREVKLVGESIWFSTGVVVKPNLVTMKRGGGQ